MRARMGIRGRLVIPAAMRRRLGLEAGMLLELTCESNSVRITRAGSGPTRKIGVTSNRP
ncbi:MAG: AbrB/MazE/SpoVT family DNA-binding domain-containing protein [Planctomycetes bacterium]|nr:AbrB/MazE/SpoVT family DNA-binding domain-containing protein [Planctomycetota bacterium]